jgi:hypothetical protein
MLKEHGDALPGPTEHQADVLARALNERGHLVIATEHPLTIGETFMTPVDDNELNFVTCTIVEATDRADWDAQEAITSPGLLARRWERFFYRVRVD